MPAYRLRALLSTPQSPALFGPSSLAPQRSSRLLAPGRGSASLSSVRRLHLPPTFGALAIHLSLLAALAALKPTGKPGVTPPVSCIHVNLPEFLGFESHPPPPTQHAAFTPRPACLHQRLEGSLTTRLSFLSSSSPPSSPPP